MYYWVYKDVRGMYRWRLHAANHKIIAESGEGYHNRQDCLQMISVVSTSGQAKVHVARGA